MNSIVEKAFDIVLDALIEKSRDEIDEILQNRKRKKILKKTFELFAEHSFSKTEYSHLSFTNCLETIDALNEKDLDPSQSIEQLKICLIPAVQQAFVSDEEEINWDQLAVTLAGYYKERAQLTTQIYDISNQLQRSENRVIKEIGEIQTIIKADEESKKRADARKELYYRTFVQRKVNLMIRVAVQNVYLFIFKNSIQCYSNQDSTIAAFEELKKYKDMFAKNVDVNFMKNPISGITIDPNGGLKPPTIQIMPADFIKWILLPQAREQIQLVLQHKDVLSPELFYAILMFEQRVEGNVLIQAIATGGGKMLENSSFQPKDVEMVINNLIDMVLDLESFYQKDQ